MTTRDPRQDKERDYTKQWRNHAAYSDKADRRKRPLAKAKEHRALRRGASQNLQTGLGPLDEIEADSLEQRLSIKRPKVLRYAKLSISLRDWLTRPTKPCYADQSENPG